MTKKLYQAEAPGPLSLPTFSAPLVDPIVPLTVVFAAARCLRSLTAACATRSCWRSVRLLTACPTPTQAEPRVREGTSMQSGEVAFRIGWDMMGLDFMTAPRGAWTRSASVVFGRLGSLSQPPTPKSQGQNPQGVPRWERRTKPLLFLFSESPLACFSACAVSAVHRPSASSALPSPPPISSLRETLSTRSKTASRKPTRASRWCPT
jgi:hypothetical protein